ncbi:translation initiation factor IF-2-like [Bubalus kerabau]|uniref:translation initiation factor IF-2-like n=1 Tax=Bubalus carabanensis TaxID=3119969 RepID=UPI00244EFD8C|nr:translation initiation factor IF-2-like [Bubalus carabanensis]
MGRNFISEFQDSLALCPVLEKASPCSTLLVSFELSLTLGSNLKFSLRSLSPWGFSRRFCAKAWGPAAPPQSRRCARQEGLLEAPGNSRNRLGLSPPAPALPARPRCPAPRRAPGAPRRPPPAPASAPRALPAAAADSLAPSAADAPGPSSECAPVPDPSPDASGPVDSRVPLLHPASPKMNVRRVESISAQLEEASSTGAKDGEALYRQQKQDQELTVAHHELLIVKFRLKLKKVGKTTRPFSLKMKIRMPIECSTSGCNCCFLTSIQVSQDIAI